MIVLVGEAPGPRGPRTPLGGRIARRLAGLCGVTEEEFGRVFERTNLLGYRPERWPVAEAEQAARDLARTDLKDRTAILMGRRVMRAFRCGADFQFFMKQVFVVLSNGDLLPYFAGDRIPRMTILAAPHPSGRSRWWNDEKNLRRAGQFWRAMYTLTLKEIDSEIESVARRLGAPVAQRDRMQGRSREGAGRRTRAGRRGDDVHRTVRRAGVAAARARAAKTDARRRRTRRARR